MIKQAAVVGLSVVPFALSSVVAYLAWLSANGVEGWRMILTVLAWIAAFAFGTQLFWKAVERLAPK
jgi:hypothetical protein